VKGMFERKVVLIPNVRRLDSGQYRQEREFNRLPDLPSLFMQLKERD